PTLRVDHPYPCRRDPDLATNACGQVPMNRKAASDDSTMHSHGGDRRHGPGAATDTGAEVLRPARGGSGKQVRAIAKPGLKVAAFVIAGATALAACSGGRGRADTEHRPPRAAMSGAPAT